MWLFFYVYSRRRLLHLSLIRELILFANREIRDHFLQLSFPPFLFISAEMLRNDKSPDKRG